MNSSSLDQVNRVTFSLTKINSIAKHTSIQPTVLNNKDEEFYKD